MRRAFLAVLATVIMCGGGNGEAMAVCGDKVVDADEDCDLGGTCIGGPAAGTPCKVGDATCTGGTCTTFGGKGCAANCTTEHDVVSTVLPGQLDGLNLVPGTSGVAIASDFLSLPLPLGSTCNGGDQADQPCVTATDCPGGTCVQAQQVLTVGKEKNGQIPIVVKAAAVKYPGIPVSSLACGCIHGVNAKTCGGTLFEPDGITLSPNCTPGFTDGDSVCAGKAPCTFVHGEGNTASGVIGCAGGLDNIDVSYEQDAGGNSGACAPPNTCPAIVHLSGHGGPGSAQLGQTLGVTGALGGCTGSDPATYGPDGFLCTDDDPPGASIISLAGTQPVVTGTATAVVHNANGAHGTDLGPVTTSGAPFDCVALECGDQSSAAGSGLVGAFTFVHLDTVGDVAVVAQLFASGQKPDPAMCGGGTVCAGDCGADGEVTVDEVIILVNIALGSTQPSACANGIPAGTEVDITLVVKAVGYALNACPA